MLAAIAFYRRQVHKDRTSAEGVLTRPGEPSALQEALNEFGFPTGLMEVTSKAFGDLAASAIKSLTVMTPFLDVHGGKWLAKLMRQTKPDVKRTIILRYVKQPSHHAYPVGIEALRSAVAGIDVEVLDYVVE